MSRGSCTDLPSELGLAVFEGYEVGCHVVDWFLNDIQGVPGGMCQTSGECSLC